MKHLKALELARRQSGGLRIIPLIFHPCAWQSVGWLAAMQCRAGATLQAW